MVSSTSTAATLTHAAQTKPKDHDQSLFERGERLREQLKKLIDQTSAILETSRQLLNDSEDLKKLRNGKDDAA
jgi:hypothetical protein